jgi:seryl-tRNA synthetase
VRGGGRAPRHAQLRARYRPFQKLETGRKALQTRTQELQAARNGLPRQTGLIKGRGEDASAAMAEVAALKSELEANEQRLAELLKDVEAFVAKDGSRSVPLTLRNAPTKLMRELDREALRKAKK